MQMTNIGWDQTMSHLYEKLTGCAMSNFLISTEITSWGRFRFTESFLLNTEFRVEDRVDWGIHACALSFMRNVWNPACAHIFNMSEYFLWCLLNVPASCVVVTVWYDFYVRLCVWTQALDWVFWCLRCADIKVRAALTKTWKSHFIKNMGPLKSQLWYLICNLSGILILHTCWMSEVIHTLTINHCIAQLNSHRWWSRFTFRLPPAVAQHSHWGGILLLDYWCKWFFSQRGDQKPLIWCV